MINFMDLQAGQRLKLKDGAVAEVVENIGDGIWVQVRYLEAPESPSMVGTEELCHCEEAVGLA
ncbi:hypothetical protein [Burkholderia cenocepacia]|uniref:hypothetical protein n=1 Tax=Burkholderia cenocepacia TaxID=95486 RepID=UPI00285CB6B3|nr:hypothetical protein [Burkholderia cenocepacia]MDR8071883.1 hypothetical protein [Burkholderia cenocepacia]